MSAPWLDSMTPVGPPTAANPTLKTLLYAAAVTGGWAGLLCLLIYVIARLAGVPFEMVAPSGSLTVIPWVAVLILPLVAATAGALLTALVRGRAHAQRIVFWLGTGVAAVSLLVPLAQPAEVLWSTRLLVAAMHILTWALVVPQLARIVGDSEPGRHLARDV